MSTDFRIIISDSIRFSRLTSLLLSLSLSRERVTCSRRSRSSPTYFVSGDFVVYTFECHQRKRNVTPFRQAASASGANCAEKSQFRDEQEKRIAQVGKQVVGIAHAHADESTTHREREGESGMTGVLFCFWFSCARRYLLRIH